MTSASPPTRLASLTSLRATAALLVFGYHAGLHLDWAPASRLLAHAYTGVGFFFVLSGFVLTWTFTPGAARRFYWRRFARIGPSHLATAALVTVAIAAQGDLSVPALALNVPLLQAWVPENHIAYGINGVSWSLSCEVAFYAACPLLFAWLVRMSPRRRAVAALAWLAGCTAVALAGVALPQVASAFARLTGGSYEAFGTVNPAVRSGEFVLGMVTAMALRGGLLPRVPLLGAVGLLAAFWPLLVLWDPPIPVANHVLAIPFAVLVAAAAGADTRGAPTRLRAGWLVYAGEVSFAFYLVHEPVLLGVRELGLRTGLATALSLIIAAVTAVALHHLVERPGQRAVLRRLDQRQRAQQQAAEGRAAERRCSVVEAGF